ncbi:MAG: hypothetical protein RI894_1167 [Bacteroidota bacterium]
MLSRRSVRIKIMQLLYGSVVSQKTLTTESAEREYRRVINQSYQAYIFALQLLMRVLEYTERDDVFRQNKYLRTAADEAFDLRLLHNPLAQALIENEAFARARSVYKLSTLGDPDNIRKFYFDFVKTEPFLAFAQKPLDELANEDYLQVILALNKHLTQEEMYQEAIEAYFSGYDDDASLIEGALKKSIKSVLTNPLFVEVHLPDEATIGEYGSDFLYKLVHFKDAIDARVNSKLENWDPERVTIIDRILLTMATAELLYCPTIPLKVTMDEYIELAKMYSTDKSKEFVNGIIDQVVRDLKTEGILNKSGRGLNSGNK